MSTDEDREPQETLPMTLSGAYEEGFLRAVFGFGGKRRNMDGIINPYAALPSAPTDVAALIAELRGEVDAGPDVTGRAATALESLSQTPEDRE